jgi:thiosulfate dehydrogenase [quinone] large subunit
MSSAVFLAGGGTWSLDALVGRTPFAACNLWFPWIGSGALPRRVLSALGLLLAAVAMLFTVGSYHMLFGGVVSPLHARVNFHRHHLALSEVVVAPDGSVRFDADVDAGPDTGAAYLIAARLVDAAGAPVATWDGEALKSAAITNVWPYVWASRFEPQTIGFSAATGARATITLPVPADADLSGDGALTLVLEAINGATWQQPARFETTTGFGTAAGILPRTPTIIERIRNGIRTPVHEAINAAT